MQNRLDVAKNTIKKIRDKLNIYLGSKRSKFSEETGKYVYSSYRYTLLQAIVGEYSEVPDRNLNLYDLSNGISLTAENVANFILGLQQVLSPFRAFPAPRNDLINAVQTAIDELAILNHHLRTECQGTPEYNIRLRAKYELEEMRKTLNMFVINERIDLNKMGPADIYSEYHTQLNMLQKIVGTEHSRDFQLNLWDLISLRDAEFLNTDHINIIVERLNAVLMINNSDTPIKNMILFIKENLIFIRNSLKLSDTSIHSSESKSEEMLGDEELEDEEMLWDEDIIEKKEKNFLEENITFSFYSHTVHPLFRYKKDLCLLMSDRVEDKMETTERSKFDLTS